MIHNYINEGIHRFRYGLNMEYMYIQINAHEDIQIRAAYFNLFQKVAEWRSG